MAIKEAIRKFMDGENLTRRESYSVMDEILSGKASEAQISAFLVALQLKGSTVDEVAGSVEAYRERLTPLSISDENAVDTSGTGGDNLGTFNISTAAAFVASGAGAKVVKHGYFSVSSRCGSADVLGALGISTELSPEDIYRVFDATGLAFVFAPKFKPIPKHFSGIRQSIGARTLINILDPLTKPALTKRHLIGVYDHQLLQLIAEVMHEFDVFQVMVVSGDNGLDEMNVCGKTYVVEMGEGSIEKYELMPEDLGLTTWPIEGLLGGDAEKNALIINGVLKGEKGAARDVTVMNAAAALKMAGVVEDLSEGVRQAENAIDEGRALIKLEEMIDIHRSS